MPNWCFNTVTIEGNAEDIKRVKAQLNKPFSHPSRDWKTDEITIVNYDNPVFAFWNIVSPPEEMYGLYHEVNGSKKDPVTGEMVRTGDTNWNWYNFNNREWGTKWDVAISNNEDPSERLVDESDTKLVYMFDTAWSPPIGALNALSEQYPRLSITNEWEEEQGFGATTVHKDGDDEEINGYDWKCQSGHMYCGDVSNIWDEDLQETVCPTCVNEEAKV